MDNEHAMDAMGEVLTSQAAGVTVALQTPTIAAPEQSVAFNYKLTDDQNGEPLMDVVISHEQPIHLIAASQDLTQFQHVGG